MEASSILVLTYLNMHMQTNELGILPYRVTEINLRWIIDINARAKTIKIFLK